MSSVPPIVDSATTSTYNKPKFVNRGVDVEAWAAGQKPIDGMPGDETNKSLPDQFAAHALEQSNKAAALAGWWKQGVIGDYIKAGEKAVAPLVESYKRASSKEGDEGKKVDDSKKGGRGKKRSSTSSKSSFRHRRRRQKRKTARRSRRGSRRA